MSAYTEAAANLQAALTPVAAYTDRAKAEPGATNGKLKHACQLDTLVDAVIAYGEAAERERLPPSPRITALSARIRALPAYEAVAERPDQHRTIGGAITSHCLPLPLHVQPLQTT